MPIDNATIAAALKRLLAHGDAMEDSKLMKMGAPKPAAAPDEMCPTCKKPLMEGKCPECGYEAPSAESEDGEMAALLEQSEG